MFLSDKPHSPEEEDAAAVNNSSENMMIEIIPVSNHHQQQQQKIHQFQSHQNQLMVLGESSGGEDHEPTKQHHHQQPQKKRAETWVQDETRILISLRREIDGLFNTSKSNKHLWEQISAKMREKGFDRNPNMCTDKWRNLLKEFKKAKHHDNRGGSGGSGKMSCYKEIEEILRDRNKTATTTTTQYKNPTTTHQSNNKVDSFMHFSDKGIEDTSISFAHVEANGRPTLNLETGLDHDGHPLAIAAADAVGANGVAPWNWRETPENGGESQSYGGRVIEVTWGDYTRRIGIDGLADAIKEAIKSAFRLRTKRTFWLEDEHQIVRSLDRDMPLGNYTLHLDEGLAVKVCLYDEADNIAVHTEDKVFYTEDDFREFLNRRAWTALREFDGYRNIENMDDLRPGAIYRGVS